MLKCGLFLPVLCSNVGYSSLLFPLLGGLYPGIPAFGCELFLPGYAHVGLFLPGYAHGGLFLPGYAHGGFIPQG